MIPESLPWYVARAGGLVSWYLLTTAVLWGLLLSSKVLGRFGKRRWLLDLHRFLGGLAVVFVGVHLVGLLTDSYVGFGLSDVLVPFATSWHPLAVAWGIVGFYVLLAVEITSLLRNRLPRRFWHAVHLGSFGLYVVASIHLWTAGTDATNPIVRTSLIASVGAVVMLTVFRVMQSQDAPPQRTARPGAGRGPTAASVLDERAPRTDGRPWSEVASWNDVPSWNDGPTRTDVPSRGDVPIA